MYVSVNSRSRVAIDKADESKTRADNEGKPLDAITVLARSIDTRTEYEREKDKMWQASIDKLVTQMAAQTAQSVSALESYTNLGNTRSAQIDRQAQQIDKQFGISASQGESIEAIQEVISKQGPTLEETRKAVKELQEQVSKLPDDIQARLQPLFDKIDQEYATLNTKLDNDRVTIKQQILDAVTEITSKVQPPAPVSQNVTVNTAPAVEADPAATRPIPGLADALPGAMNAEVPKT